MEAIKLIERDHRMFRRLFKRYDQAIDRPKAKGKIARELFGELAAHEGMEEEVFYPALRRRVSEKVEDTVKEGIQEHHVADLLVDELRPMNPEDEAFDPKFTVLRENVEHHLEEEEEGLLPKARKVFSREELADIGSRMERTKKRLLDGRDGGPGGR